MPITASAVKRVRQNQKRQDRNRGVKSRIKTLTRNLLETLESGSPEEAQAALTGLHSALDKAVKQKVMHANTASRQKSRMARQVQAAAPSVEETVSA